MSNEEKKLAVYIFEEKSYLVDKWSNANYYIANGCVRGLPQTTTYPDYISFDCKVEFIDAVRNVPDKNILSCYRLKDKFVGLAGRLIELPPDTDKNKVDLEIYEECFVNIKQPDEVTRLDLMIIDKNNIPAIPQWCKVEPVYQWHVKDLTDLSKYPCYVDARDAFDLLCMEAKKIIKDNPEIFKDYKEYTDYGWFKWIRCDKKTSGYKSESIELNYYNHQNPIKGKNFPELQSNVNAYLEHNLRVIKSPISVDLPSFPAKLPYGCENYFEVKDGNDVWVCMKLDYKTKPVLDNYLNSPFEKSLKSSKIGKALLPLFAYIKKIKLAEPKYKINP